MVGFGMTDVEAERAKKESPDYLFKIILIGDAGTGKSSTIKRFTADEFESEYKSTIGVDFATKSVEFSGKLIKLQIWDTAGEERYRKITNSYYRGAHGILIVYDLTSKESFENVRSWVSEVKKNGHSDVKIVVVATKVDLENKREVTDEDIKELVKELDLEHFEISCVTGEGIHSLFQRLVEKMTPAKEESEQDNNIIQTSTMIKPMERQFSMCSSFGPSPPVEVKKKSKTCVVL